MTRCIQTIITVAVALSLAAGSAKADGPDGRVDTYVAEALRANPMLAAHASRVDAARAAARTRGVMPDPVLGFGYFVETPETRVGPQESAWTLSQRIPLFGKLGLERDIADRLADMVEQDYRRESIDLRYNVKKWFYELFAVVNVTRVLEEEREILRGMEEVAQVRYGSGLASQQDALKAQLALSQIEDELEVASRRRATAEAAMRRLLNRDVDATLTEPFHDGVMTDLPPLERLISAALTHRPEVAAAGIAIARAGRARSLAKRTYWPDVTVGAQYIQVGERDDIQIDDNGRDVFQLSAAINIPIWAGGRRAAVEQADADAARAHSEKTGWETSVRNQVRDAHVRVRTAAERVALHRDVIIPQAEQTFGASESAYQTGELSFLDLLDSERMLLSARKKYFEVLADYGLQLATLEKSLGAALDEIR